MDYEYHGVDVRDSKGIFEQPQWGPLESQKRLGQSCICIFFCPPLNPLSLLLSFPLPSSIIFLSFSRSFSSLLFPLFLDGSTGEEDGGWSAGQATFRWPTDSLEPFLPLFGRRFSLYKRSRLLMNHQDMWPQKCQYYFDYVQPCQCNR